MRSSGVRVVLTLGRPDPDRLSTATLWSLIAHFGLLAGMIVLTLLPRESTKLGEPHFVTLAPGLPAAGGGGSPRAEPAPPRPEPPKAETPPPPAPKEPSEPPPPPVRPSNRTSLPSEKAPKPAPATPRESTQPPADEGRGTTGEEPAGGAGVPGAPPGPGGGTAGEAGGVGGTSFGEGFRYGWYRTALEAKLRSSWRKPLATAGVTQTATVSFVILRNGTVKDVRVVTASGNPTMDLSAMRAVYDAAPLPPLPRGWSGDSVHVSMEFSLEPGAP